MSGFGVTGGSGGCSGHPSNCIGGSINSYPPGPRPAPTPPGSGAPNAPIVTPGYWLTVTTTVPTYEPREYISYDGTAHSIGVLRCDGYYTFYAPLGTVGAVVGLTSGPQPVGYGELTHAIAFVLGRFNVIESRVQRLEPQSFAATDRFFILRQDDTVYYLRDNGTGPYTHAEIEDPPGVVFYTSTVESVGNVVLKAALFQGGDSVIGMDGPHVINECSAPEAGGDVVSGFGHQSWIREVDAPDVIVSSTGSWSLVFEAGPIDFVPEIVWSLSGADMSVIVEAGLDGPELDPDAETITSSNGSVSWVIEAGVGEVVYSSNGSMNYLMDQDTAAWGVAFRLPGLRFFAAVLAPVVSAPRAAVGVSGRVPVARALSLVPLARVRVSGRVPSAVQGSGGPVAFVTVSGRVMATAVTSLPGGAVVNVAAMGPQAGTVSVAPGVWVAVRGLVPIAVAAALGAGAAVGAAALPGLSAASTRAQKGLVWVAGRVPAPAAEATGTALLLNAATMAVSRYSVAVLDVLEIDGALYWVTPNGLLAEDPGGPAVRASLTTGMLALGADGRKRVRELVANLAADGLTEVWVTVEVEGRTHEIGPYGLVGRPGTAPLARRLRLGGGVKGDSLALRIESAGGTDWELGGLALPTELL